MILLQNIKKKLIYYLGACITRNGRSNKEIRRRLALTNAGIDKFDRIWKNYKITKITNLRLLKACFFFNSDIRARNVDNKRIDVKWNKIFSNQRISENSDNS